jgi:membrane protease YdiL (CAAX protease family)
VGSKGYERLYGLLPVFWMALFWSLTQEMLFRGMMWHALESAGFETGLVNVLQALLYAVPFHRANLLGAAVLIALGLWLGWFRRRDGNIATAVLFHMVALCLILSPNEIGSWFM